MSAAIHKGRDVAAPLIADLIAAGRETGDHEAVFTGAITLIAGGMARAAGFDATLKALQDCIEVTQVAKRMGVN